METNPQRFFFREDLLFVEKAKAKVHTKTVSHVHNGVTSTREYTMETKICNKSERGYSFLFICNGECISGERSRRITVMGAPGCTLCSVDTFYIDPVHRCQGHGPYVMEMILELYRIGGTQFMRISNPSGQGKRFYLRTGFKTKNTGDLDFEFVVCESSLSLFTNCCMQKSSTTKSVVSAKAVSWNYVALHPPLSAYCS
jgi:hypothetical protein